MTAIVWEPTLTAIDAALVTERSQRPSATNTAEGSRLRERLRHMGMVYGAVYTEPVDQAKALSATRTEARRIRWERRARSVHDQADALARQVLAIAGESLQALAFTSSPSAVIGRLDSAIATVAAGTGFDAKQRDYLPELLTTHKGAVQQAYADQPTGTVAEAPYDTTSLSSLWDDRTVYDLGTGAVLATVRELETALQDVLNDVAVWLAVVGAA